MRVDLGRLPEEGLRIEEDVPAEVLDLHEDDIEIRGPVHCKVKAVRVSDELLVDGTIAVPARFRCTRCAEMFDTEVVEPQFHHDCAVDKGSEFVDLTAEIRESILLSFPVYPVCRADCRGLCPKCGANRNRKSCRCKTQQDDQWNALDGLVLR